MPGLQVGLWHEVNLSRKIALAAELYFATKGRSFEYIQNNETTRHPERTLGLTLPILLRYQIVPKLSLEVGPAVDYTFTKTVSLDFIGLLHMNSLSFSAVGGLIYQLNNRWSTDLHYEYGLSNILQFTIPGNKQTQNRSLQVSMQYQLSH